MNTIVDGFHTSQLIHFEIRTLASDSLVLKENPLGDPSRRYHPVLIPRSGAPIDGWPVIFVLAGFSGNGPNYFNQKTFEANLPQTLDQCVDRGEAPRAVYVFCDAMTSWGGSQFVNSEGTGRYEDFVGQELVAVVKEELQVSSRTERWAVVGGSSGGYGALHLGSQYPETFGYIGAIAPDSFFEASLLPELWSATPTLFKVGGVRGVLEEKTNGRLFKRKESHTVLNAVAMGLCYAADGRGDFDLPIDPRTGTLIPEIWKRWKDRDPIVFLRDRPVEQIRSIYLDVGTRDQYQLQYGTRQIFDLLTKKKAKVSYREFEGTHFDIGDRRPQMWKWLNESWT